MSEENDRSVVINIPKPRQFVNKDTHIFKTRRSVKQTTKPKRSEKKYVLPPLTVIKPVPMITLGKDEIMLPYLRYSKKQEKDRFSEKLGISIRDNYKIAYSDLRKRLQTEDPVNDCRCVTDFDPTFFMCVHSLQLSSYIAPYKSLTHVFNSQLRWRQEVGYRRDCMLNIDMNYKKEKQIYDSNVKRYLEQVKLFDEFILADYRKSMLSLTKWEKLKMALDQKATELQYLAAVKFNMTSKIVGLDYRYGLQQKYGRFLYYLSPPSWRLKNRNFARSIEIEAKGFDFGSSNEEDTFTVIFEKLKKECRDGLVKPALYFKHPEELLELFVGIEEQELNHFTHVSYMAPHLKFLKKGIKLFKDIIAQDSAGIVAVIKEFETMLQFYTEQCSQLKNKFFKILYGVFYDNVGAPEILKLQLHLEFCYAKTYNDKPMNLTVSRMTKALEHMYMDYSKRLDSVTAAHIRTAVKQYVEFERHKLRRAKMAARELRQFERLERALLHAFAPAKARQNLPKYETTAKHTTLKKGLAKPVKSPSEVNRRSLTESEQEYLKLFTDWTEQEDPAHYLKSFSIENEDQNRC